MGWGRCSGGGVVSINFNSWKENGFLLIRVTRLGDFSKYSGHPASNEYPC